MAKKKPTKKTKAKRVENADEWHLERLIAGTERAITSEGSSVDEFFKQQAARLRKQLKELRAKNAVRK